jgi:Flp pilus assembly protein TadG
MCVDFIGVVFSLVCFVLFVVVLATIAGITARETVPDTGDTSASGARKNSQKNQ